MLRFKGRFPPNKCLVCIPPYTKRKSITSGIIYMLVAGGATTWWSSVFNIAKSAYKLFNDSWNHTHTEFARTNMKPQTGWCLCFYPGNFTSNLKHVLLPSHSLTELPSKSPLNSIHSAFSLQTKPAVFFRQSKPQSKLHEVLTNPWAMLKPLFG